jgi:hypothetical protein
MMDYVEVYRLSWSTLNWALLVALCLPVLFAGSSLFVRIRFRKTRPPWGVVVLIGAVGLYTISVAGEVVLEYLQGIRRQESGAYSILEGPVKNFRAGPDSAECFSVQLRTFCYSNKTLKAGFNRVVSSGAPMRDGIHVRIAYVGSLILRMEIDRSDLHASWERLPPSMYRLESFQRHMRTALEFTSLCVAVWFLIEGRRMMCFWAAPPYRRSSVFLFYSFCLMGLGSAFYSLIFRLIDEPSSGRLASAVISIAVCALIVFLIWLLRRRLEAKRLGLPVEA